MGCAQPSCVASPDYVEEDSNFLTDSEGQSDGFFREGDKELKRFRDQSAHKLIANCSGNFADLSCPRKDQWVGGIEFIDHPRQPLILQCCTFEGLRFSQDVGVTNVGPGEAITGGEVVREGRQISFDVIANVRKVMDANTHEISYEVTVRRMNCLPDPPEPEVPFDTGVSDEVVKILTKATNGGSLATESNMGKKESPGHLSEEKAFAVMTQKFDEKKHKKKNKIHRPFTTIKPEPEPGQHGEREIADKTDSRSVSSVQAPPPEQNPGTSQGGKVAAERVAQPISPLLNPPPQPLPQPVPQLGAPNLAPPPTAGGSQQGVSEQQSVMRIINVSLSSTQNAASGQPEIGGIDSAATQQQPSQQAANINTQAQNYNGQYGQPQNSFTHQQYQSFNGQTKNEQFYGNTGNPNNPQGGAAQNANGNNFGAQVLNNQNVNANQQNAIPNSQSKAVDNYNNEQRGQSQVYNAGQHSGYNANIQNVQSPLPTQGASSPAFPQHPFPTLPPHPFVPAALPPSPFSNLWSPYGAQQQQRQQQQQQQQQQQLQGGPQLALPTPLPIFQPQPFHAGFPLLPTQTPAAPVLFGAPLLSVNSGFAQPGIIPGTSLARGNVNVQQPAVDPQRAAAVLVGSSAGDGGPQPQLSPAPATLPPPTLPPLPSFEQMMAIFGVRNGTLATLPTLPTIPTLAPFSVVTPAPPPPSHLQGNVSPIPTVRDGYGMPQHYQPTAQNAVPPGPIPANAQLQAGAPGIKRSS
ncbi:unnamed protein product [Toxocara canis]|uniref:Uncharacterized protein n=1 Tax=Toxocara canis TaxID=6265 RepID=A0A3P7IQA3_TOXCA|nr:unnamed protein product [Toxocara canis]